MFAAFATNPGSLGTYAGFAVLAILLAIAAKLNWQPNDRGKTARPLAVLCAVASVIVLAFTLYIGVDEGNRQEREADQGRQESAEADRVGKVADQRFSDYSVTLNSGYDYIEVTIDDKACSVRVKLIYTEVDSEFPRFWLNTGGDITRPGNAVLQREVLDGSDLRNMVC